MSEKSNIPKQKKNTKVEFTEFEIVALKEFINKFDERTQKAKIEREQNGKESIFVKIDIPILEKIKKQSEETDIPISNIINTILSKEFLKKDT